MKRRYTILVVAGIVIIILAAALSFNYPREDFSVYNGQWNGDSDLRTLVQNDHPSSVIFGEKDLSGKSSGALLLINLNGNVGFSQDDISSIRSFVTAGGSLLIANDFGNANQLLDGLGIGSVARFNGPCFMTTTTTGRVLRCLLSLRSRIQTSRQGLKTCRSTMRRFSTSEPSTALPLGAL